ncbi:BCCT family transporter [Chakrabartyella piscis]|uniref:BCCT family transporter n=1 Tax=Chakrabartyella piscis TaxID=2918914 RepID=UPI00295888D6|nr:BCCT family transporter [Chakrabartyella piscis]
MEKKKGKLTERYEVVLMTVSLLIIGGVVTFLTLYPEQGNAIASSILYMLTRTFGSTMQIITVIITVFLIALCFTKYGDIKLGKGKPQYKTMSWVAMMFFCGQGSGTVYWAFTEWGYHFNAAPQLNGVEVSEPMAYELALAYSIYDWGPIPWALLCIFVLPFAFHYYIKKDDELKFSLLTKYAVGEKRAKGVFGKVVDFIFIFSAVGSICITAGAAGSTIAIVFADLIGIEYSFGLTFAVLLGVAILYSASSLLGIEKGMRRISDWNIYFCLTLLALILFMGPTQFIIDSMVNAMGILSTEVVRMTLWTDPVAVTGYPQDWTVFYFVYWFVFGPFTGLFVAKISKGRTLREIILNMLITGSAGMVMFFGIVTAYQQNLRITGILDIPGMLASGQSAETIALDTLRTLPMSSIMIVLYLTVTILFLATTLDATSFALSSTVSKNLGSNEEPKKGLKLVWCLVLISIPVAITYAGTNINTIKAFVIATGMPLVIIIGIIYYGFLKEMKKDFGHMTKEEIQKGDFLEDADFGKEVVAEEAIEG